MAGIGGVIRNDQGVTLLSYSSPVGLCLCKKVELLSPKIGLREAVRFNPQLLIVEGDSSCAIKWASQASMAPWYLIDVVEEVAEIAKNIKFSYNLITRSANSEADSLAKEGVCRLSLCIVTDC